MTLADDGCRADVHDGDTEATGVGRCASWRSGSRRCDDSCNCLWDSDWRGMNGGGERNQSECELHYCDLRNADVDDNGGGEDYVPDS